MKFTLRIESSNAAFDGVPELEVARILKETARRVTEGYSGGILQDVNGNTVGKWKMQ